MKIVYLANIRLPTEKAHGAQIMETCESLARAGHEVDLVVTNRATPITGDSFAYYGVKPIFRIVRVRVADTLRFGRFGFLFEMLTFARGCLSIVRRSGCDIVYGRDEMVLAYVGKRFAAPLVWETHTGAQNRWARYLLKRATLIIAITKGLEDFYVRLGAPQEKIIVAPDGVDLEQFAQPESGEVAKARLGLPSGKKIAMYIGRLDGWKGSATLLEASNLLPPDILVAVIGGESAQVEDFKRKYPRVMFLGHRPYREIAGNQAAADVLILPNTGRDVISERFTSPLKLFTYMASGKPIVSSDLPSIREVLDDTGAYFVEPDNAGALAEGIEAALHDSEAQGKALRAHELVRAYTWDSRVDTILRAIGRSNEA